MINRQNPLPVGKSIVISFPHFSTIVDILSIYLSGTSLYPVFGTEKQPALLETGVTVPISSELYAASFNLFIQLFVTIVSLFKSIMSLL